jgi:SNF2 family DNA or RNA helicase
VNKVIQPQKHQQKKMKSLITLQAPHQVEGVEWLLSREKSPKAPYGGILCDEMGLGKTIQMIELMVRNFKTNTLIVVPKSLVQQWVSELKRFAPLFTVCVYDGSNRKYNSQSDICICPYSVLVDLVGVNWGRVILDEGHEIRNRSSLVHKTAMQLRSKVKWVLTGTPIFNRFRDFVSICDFVGIPLKILQQDEVSVRTEYVLRRTKKMDVPMTFHNVELEMYESERALYERVYDELQESECVLEGILRCRQVCAWPQTYYDGMHKKFGRGEREIWEGSTAKMDSLTAFIQSHPREKSLVFTQFYGETHEIQRRLVKLGRAVFILDGQTENRECVVQSFRKSPDEGAVFIIQIKTGGVGLNLQDASRVYITQPSWNPATELQAIARSYRSGQTKHVIVKKLVYAECDTVDNEITRLQIKKSKICARVIGEHESVPAITLTESNFYVTLGSKENDTHSGVAIHG